MNAASGYGHKYMKTKRLCCTTKIACSSKRTRSKRTRSATFYSLACREDDTRFYFEIIRSREPFGRKQEHSHAKENVNAVWVSVEYASHVKRMAESPFKARFIWQGSAHLEFR